MKGHRWNKVRQRLSEITDTGLDISFNNSPVRKKTQYSEITLRFFQVKLNGEVIWRFPKDSKQPTEGFLYGIDISTWNSEKYSYERLEFPIMSIIKYLDLSKDRLIHYEDKAGLSDVLKVCDRRLGHNRLKNLDLSEVAKQIFDARFKNKKP